MNDRQIAVCQWAKSHLDAKDFVIVDTETTGLGPDAEVVSIAVVNAWGRVAFQSLVRPSNPIDENGDAFRVHGISNAMVKQAPFFQSAYLSILPWLSEVPSLIAYNAQFDYRMICQSIVNGIVPPIWQCAMLRYAEYYGELGLYDDWKWQRLSNACRQMDLSPRLYHDAASDALATYDLMNALAAKLD